MKERADSDFLEQEAPILSRLKGEGKSPYLMPEGYMESLKDSLLAEAKKIENHPSQAKVIPLFSWIKPAAIAASFLLLGWVGYSLWVEEVPQMADTNAVGLEEINAYVEANFEDFEEELEEVFLSEVSADDLEGIEWDNTILIDDLDDNFWEELDEQTLEELL